MKETLPVLTMFGLGVALGAGGFIPQWLLPKGITMTILCILVFQVGLSIGSNDKFKDMIRGFRPSMLLFPLFTIAGTLLFSVLASLFISGRSTADCLAVGSGFAYYSLSSVLITELKSASAGVQIATELGTLALLANIVREVVSLLGAPLFSRFFGKFAPISAAGINSMDVLLPSISRYSGKEMIPAAIMHGIALELSVPLLVSLFCGIE